MAHPEVDIAVICLIGIATLKESSDHTDDVWHVPRRRGLQVWWHQPQGSLVLVHGVDELSRQCRERNAAFIGPLKDLVVDIGDVAHIGDPIAKGTQVTHDDIEGDHDPSMADVTVVVHCHATDIDPDLPLDQGHEGSFFAGKAVVDLHSG